MAPPSISIAEGTVWIVEDDLESRESIVRGLDGSVPRIRECDSAESFFAEFDAQRPACVLVDERLPGIYGSELLTRLREQGNTVSAILMTGFATTKLAVEAMRNGAVTVLEKPSTEDAVRAAVLEALEKDQATAAGETNRENAKARISQLSPNEREVLQMVIDGMPNKQIASKLGVCVRTVEARRSRIYQETEVSSVAELVRLCVAAGFVDSRP